MDHLRPYRITCAHTGSLKPIGWVGWGGMGTFVHGLNCRSLNPNVSHALMQTSDRWAGWGGVLYCTLLYSTLLQSTLPFSTLLFSTLLYSLLYSSLFFFLLSTMHCEIFVTQKFLHDSKLPLKIRGQKRSDFDGHKRTRAR